jgi:predicted RNase H-like HicB family nuclease
MKASARIVYWFDKTHWLGYFESYPDYWTQGDSLEELREMLRSLWLDLTSDELPGIRKVEELVLA